MSTLDETGRFDVNSQAGRTEKGEGPDIVIDNVMGSDGLAVFSMRLSLDEAERLAAGLTEQIERARKGDFSR